MTTVLNSVPDALRKIEFLKVELHLELVDEYRFDLNHLLLLRSRFQKAIKDLSLTQDTTGLQNLFDPPPSSDPVAVRRYQKPGPPFVIHPPTLPTGRLLPGDVLKLPMVVLGDGIGHLAGLIGLFTELGKFGLTPEGGRFVLVSVRSFDASGTMVSLWERQKPVALLAPPICEAHWLLSAPPAATPCLRLVFLTPARLLSAGRPLFRCEFRRLFPFILRRVASMAHAHCGVELIDDATALLDACARVEVLVNRLAWEDWRRVDARTAEPALGGLVGELELAGDALGELRWVLELGSLLNLGKGASFCAGHYRLEIPRTV